MGGTKHSPSGPPSNSVAAHMTTFNRTSISASCPGCGEQDSHQLTFENKRVRHLRCESCQAIHVFAYKGSFHAQSSALDFAAVTGAAQNADVGAYGAGNAFYTADLFEHPKFGTGYVLAVLSPPKKMEVLFTDKMRVLVCGAGSGEPKSQEPEPEKKPRPSKRRASSSRAKDKVTAHSSSASSVGEVARPCPKCGQTVHPFNMYRGPAGDVVSCMHCR